MLTPTNAIESRLHLHGQTSIGVRGYRLVAAAVLGQSVFIESNSVKTHPGYVQTSREGERFSSHHAEIAALTKIRPDLRHRAKLFVCRIRASVDHGHCDSSEDDTSRSMSIFTLAKPCSYCVRWITSMGVSLRHVYFTDINGQWQRLG